MNPKIFDQMAVEVDTTQRLQELFQCLYWEAVVRYYRLEKVFSEAELLTLPSMEDEDLFDCSIEAERILSEQRSQP